MRLKLLCLIVLCTNNDALIHRNPTVNVPSICESAGGVAKFAKMCQKATTDTTTTGDVTRLATTSATGIDNALKLNVGGDVTADSSTSATGIDNALKLDVGGSNTETWSQADIETSLRHFAKASRLRSKILSDEPLAERVGGLSRAAALATLAHDQRHSADYIGALKTVRAALIAPGATPLLYLLGLLESEMLTCTGYPLEAMARYAKAVKTKEENNLTVETTPLYEIGLLRRALRADPPPPQRVTEALFSRLERLIEAALIAGPWRLSKQLPEHYDSKFSIGASPWHDIDTSPSHIIDSANALRKYASALSIEYIKLKNSNMLVDETECIIEKGKWQVFLPQRDHGGADIGQCDSTIAPVACALAEELRSLNLNVMRVSYSALAPLTSLAPHCGPTNTVHKLHVTLIVPTTSSSFSSLTVGNITRSHNKQGEVWYFDDSFLHSAINTSPIEERVVFQVVFKP